MAALIRWRPGWFAAGRDPFSELERFHGDMERLWSSVFGHRAGLRGAGVFPAVNISEDKDYLYVRAEVPGISPDDLEITTEENSLAIRGERRIPAEAENVSYHRREREAGSFHRITALPVPVSSEKVTATCRDGVLTVRLPKAPEARPVAIKVRPA